MELVDRCTKGLGKCLGQLPLPLSSPTRSPSRGRLHDTGGLCLFADLAAAAASLVAAALLIAAASLVAAACTSSKCQQGSQPRTVVLGTGARLTMKAVTTGHRERGRQHHVLPQPALQLTIDGSAHEPAGDGAVAQQRELDLWRRDEAKSQRAVVNEAPLVIEARGGAPFRAGGGRGVCWHRARGGGGGGLGGGGWAGGGEGALAVCVCCGRVGASLGHGLVETRRCCGALTEGCSSGGLWTAAKLHQALELNRTDGKRELHGAAEDEAAAEPDRAASV